MSRYVFEQTESGVRRWNGLTYQSKHGDDLRNWAILEPATPEVLDVSDVRSDDPDLFAALQLHRLVLG